MLEEIPYSHFVSVTDEEPPTHHSLMLNLTHRVSHVPRKNVCANCNHQCMHIASVLGNRLSICVWVGYIQVVVC